MRDTELSLALCTHSAILRPVNVTRDPKPRQQRERNSHKTPGLMSKRISLQPHYKFETCLRNDNM